MTNCSFLNIFTGAIERLKIIELEFINIIDVDYYNHVNDDSKHVIIKYMSRKYQQEHEENMWANRNYSDKGAICINDKYCDEFNLKIEFYIGYKNLNYQITSTSKIIPIKDSIIDESVELSTDWMNENEVKHYLKYLDELITKNENKIDGIIIKKMNVYNNKLKIKKMEAELEEQVKV